MTLSAQIWVHATDPAVAPAAQVLGQALRDELQEASALVSVTHPRSPEAMVSDPAVIDERLADPALRAIVLLGDALPIILIERAAARGLGLFLADTDAPEPKGLRRLVPGYGKKITGHFTQIFTRSPQAMLSLRARHPEVRILAVGALAVMPPAPSCNEAELQSLRAATGTRSMWMACLPPAAEAQALIDAHVMALRRAHDLLLIAQPGDASAAQALSDAACAARLRVSDLAAGEDLDESTQLCLLDPEEDPGLYTRLSALCYLGGTLTPARGEIRAPLVAAERAAALGSALIMGPHLPRDQRDFLQSLVAEDAALQVADVDALADALAEALQPERGAALALRAWTLATDGADATAQVAQAVVDWLDRQEGG